MFPDDTPKMPSSREVFQGVLNMLDCFAIYSMQYGPGLTEEEAKCIRQIRAIIDTQLNKVSGNA